MAFLPLRSLADRSVERIEHEWLDRIGHELAAPDCNRPLLCRRTLAELAAPQYAANWEEAVADEKLPLGTRLSLAALDPRNVTLEPEYYADCDDARFQRVKPLLWLWYSFDRLPLGGQAVDLGVRLLHDAVRVAVDIRVVADRDLVPQPDPAAIIEQHVPVHHDVVADFEVVAEGELHVLERFEVLPDALEDVRRQQTT